MFSPHARGWPENRNWSTNVRGRSPRTRGDGPQCFTPGAAAPRRSPRTRGDGPRYGMTITPRAMSSPRTRGDGPRSEPMPTHCSSRSPRTRGDGPLKNGQLPENFSRSPRTRGDGPASMPGSAILSSVLPARAGMARETPGPWNFGDDRSPRTRGDGPRLIWAARPSTTRSPRTRGDGPITAADRKEADKRSPRTRGDGPLGHGLISSRRQVLPARAGMARVAAFSNPVHPEFSPHARGWPDAAAGRLGWAGSSPRTRGDGPELVAARGIGSPVLPARAGMARTGGRDRSKHPSVLPARAGMARSGERRTTCRRCVLPARAGMARAGPACAITWGPFSPHARGWPVRQQWWRGARFWFSPHARGWPGRSPDRLYKASSSPRTRGDGPNSSPAATTPSQVLPARAGMARHLCLQPTLLCLVLPARAGMARSVLSVCLNRC